MNNLTPEQLAFRAGYEQGRFDAQVETAQQQEPVAWRVRWPKMGGGYKWIMNDAPLMAEHGFINEPLYTSPHPAQQQEPVAQKPYAYEYGVDNGDGTYSVHIDRGSLVHTGAQYEYCAPRNPHPEHPVTPLYTSPPASKPWVELTVDEVWKDDDVMALNSEMGLSLDQMMELVEWANAKLREKNNG